MTSPGPSVRIGGPGRFRTRDHCAGSSGDLLPPSPPAEEAARQYGTNGRKYGRMWRSEWDERPAARWPRVSI
jgi:hypothetical protein